MVTNSKQPNVEELLGRSRNSVNISFAQLLAYIDKITQPIPDGDIKTLLRTYRDMADKFYTQFENSLLEKIKDQSVAQIQASQVIEYLKNLPDTDPEKMGLNTAIPLLEKARSDALAEYNNLTTNFPTLLQNALDKLKDEWQRLNTIAVASKALAEDEKLIRAMQAVVTAAGYSVGIEAERIAIVPSNAFALYFFTYLENFAVLTVPIYSVRAPWELSICWHELAGYRVRHLKRDTTIDSIRTNLVGFHDRYKTMTDSEKNDLLNLVTRYNVDDKDHLSERKNESGRGYLGNFFSPNELDLRDLGGFEHQFEQMLENLPKEGRFQDYEQIKAEGWCVDWFEELFEDAWSIMAIREPFLEFFKDILSRHIATDRRHPPLEVRLSVADEVLKLMNSESEMDSPMSVEESAAQQILKFMSLLTVVSYQLGKRDEDPFDMRQIFQNALAVVVGTQIGKSISHWSTEFLGASNRARDAKEHAEDLINELSDQEIANFISGLASTKDQNNQLDASYEKLLDGKDYKQLLGFSFFEQDFGFGQTGTIVYDVQMIGKPTISQAALSAPITIIDGGEVSFKANQNDSDDQRKKTTKILWNQRALNNQFN